MIQSSCYSQSEIFIEAVGRCEEFAAPCPKFSKVSLNLSCKDNELPQSFGKLMCCAEKQSKLKTKMRHSQKLFTPSGPCEEYERWADGLECSETCEFLYKFPKPMCMSTIHPGCYCLPDHYRDDSGKCVPATQCKSNCASDEVLAPCDEKCLAVCPSADEIRTGIRDGCTNYGCTHGKCVCAEGFAKSHGVCVPEAECPAHPKP